MTFGIGDGDGDGDGYGEWIISALTVGATVANGVFLITKTSPDSTSGSELHATIKHINTTAKDKDNFFIGI